MAETNNPTFTHFEMTKADLPFDFYVAIGRALHRWSQLEATVCALGTSIHKASWLEAVGELRRSGGFQVSRVFKLLKDRARALNGSEPAMADLECAEKLFAARKELFHSVWGYVTGPKRKAVGIQEWSTDDFSSFRPVDLDELEKFAEDCAKTWESLMKTALPLFHGGSSTIVVEDGLTKPFDIEGSSGGAGPVRNSE
uniref:Uncharacterized protein n=1 Tax=Rhodopseudomonas palustris (strain DX-1) TaxID=652103 RepID=E6VMK4_RHOPX